MSRLQDNVETSIPVSLTQSSLHLTRSCHTPVTDRSHIWSDHNQSLMYISATISVDTVEVHMRRGCIVVAGSIHDTIEDREIFHRSSLALGIN